MKSYKEAWEARYNGDVQGMEIHRVLNQMLQDVLTKNKRTMTVNKITWSLMENKEKTLPAAEVQEMGYIQDPADEGILQDIRPISRVRNVTCMIVHPEDHRPTREVFDVSNADDYK